MKLCLFVAMCACLVFYSFAGVANPNLENLGHGEYSFYSTDVVTSELITRTTDLGFSFIYHCDSRDAAEVRRLFGRIDGESIKLHDKASATSVLRTLGYTEVSRTGTMVYAYSPRGKSFIRADGQRVNLQVAYSGNTVIVGWPVILGSY